MQGLIVLRSEVINPFEIGQGPGEDVEVVRVEGGPERAAKDCEVGAGDVIVGVSNPLPFQTPTRRAKRCPQFLTFERGTFASTL